MDKTSQSPFIAVADLARHLGLTRMAIVKRIQSGRIKAIKIGRSYAIPRSYLSGDWQSHRLPKELTDITYLSVPELAQKLGLSRMAVFLKIKRGEIQAERVGRHYVIPVKNETLAPDPAASQPIQQPPAKGVYLSLPELAQSLGISRNAVYQKVKKGIIPATKVGRHYSVAKDFKFAIPEGPPPELRKDKDYLSIAEVARQQGVSRIAIFKKVKKGQIKAIRIGRSYAIPKRNVDINNA